MAANNDKDAELYEFSLQEEVDSLKMKLLLLESRSDHAGMEERLQQLKMEIYNNISTVQEDIEQLKSQVDMCQRQLLEKELDFEREQSSPVRTANKRKTRTGSVDVKALFEMSDREKSLQAVVRVFALLVYSSLVSHSLIVALFSSVL
jgi:hypothetical protein